MRLSSCHILKIARLAVALAPILPSQDAAAGQQPLSLKEAFKNDFLIGVALNNSQFDGGDPRAAAIVREQFDSISPENCLKWQSVHPEPGIFKFAAADKYVAFGEQNHMFIVGHNLIWHSQTPDWVFQDARGHSISREALIARMRRHIFTVVGRYKGVIAGWDVVNEALNEDGSLRDSPWRRIIGDDYLVLAYQFAHAADPRAQLYYNDYSLENRPKRNGAVKLIRKLQAAGIPIYAVGLEGHYGMDWPATNQLDKTIRILARLGVKASISELDIDMLPGPPKPLYSPRMRRETLPNRAEAGNGADISKHFAAQAKYNPYANGLPDSMQQALAQRYQDLFKVLVADRASIERVTLWGVTDAQSWLNYWPIFGRTSYPLLFGRDYLPKRAFQAVLNTAK
jgi:endo-1,4-beta-xylanase